MMIAGITKGTGDVVGLTIGEPVDPVRVLLTIEVEVDRAECRIDPGGVCEINDFLIDAFEAGLVQARRYAYLGCRSTRFLTEEENDSQRALDEFIADRSLDELANRHGYRLRGLRAFPARPYEYDHALVLQAYRAEQPEDQPFRFEQFHNLDELRAFVSSLADTNPA